MFNLKIVKKDQIEVYEKALAVYEKALADVKEVIKRKDEVINNLMKRADELVEEKEEHRSDAMKARNTLRVIDNIVLNKEKGITPTNKINQIIDLRRGE